MESESVTDAGEYASSNYHRRCAIVGEKSAKLCVVVKI
jgi:hypothetical protein